MKESFDVVIVGGSVAGASLAHMLGSEGISTAIIESKSFPRRKACGECLSDVGLRYLERLDLNLGELEHVRISGYQVWGKYARSRLLAGTELKGIGVQRSLLDQLLYSSLGRYGSVTPIYGVKVEKITSTNEENFSIQLADRKLSSKHLVLADGVNSRFATNLAVPTKHLDNPVWGYSWLFEGEFKRPLEHVHIIPKGFYELYLTPVGTQRINASYLIKKHGVRSFSLNEREKHAEIQSALKKLEFIGEPVDMPLFIGPTGSTRRAITHKNIFLIGDALESVDPISGMGMTLAILSADLVKECLVKLLVQEACSSDVQEELSKKREDLYKTFRGFTKISTTLIRSRSPLLYPVSKTTFPKMFREALQQPHTTSLCSSLLSFLGS